MAIWGFVEARMKILGAVNLLTAFPPLANAMVIALHAADVREEASIRGWPSEVYEFMRSVRERIGLELISEVFSRLLSNNDFVENLGDIVYYDLLERGDSRLTVSAYNYISSLEDIGFKLAPHVICVDEDYAAKLVDLTGGSIRDLRALDLAFISRIKSRYGVEPLEEGVESYEAYVCSPEWITRIKGKIGKLLKPNSENTDFKQLLSDLLKSNRRLYSYLKIAYTKGARVAWERRNLVKTLPGRIETLKPILEVASEDSIPILNYSLEDIISKAMSEIEGELTAEACSNNAHHDYSVVILENVPSLEREELGRVLVKLRDPVDLEILKALAHRLGVEIELSGGCVKLGLKTG